MRYIVDLIRCSWVVPLHLLTGLGFCQFPGRGRLDPAKLLDHGTDFIFELFLSNDAMVEALFRDYRELDLCPIQQAGLLWSIVKLESDGQSVGFFQVINL